MEWTTFLWISGVYWGLYLIYGMFHAIAIVLKSDIDVGGELPQPA